MKGERSREDAGHRTKEGGGYLRLLRLKLSTYLVQSGQNSSGSRSFPVSGPLSRYVTSFKVHCSCTSRAHPFLKCDNTRPETSSATSSSSPLPLFRPPPDVSPSLLCPTTSLNGTPDPPCVVTLRTRYTCIGHICPLDFIQFIENVSSYLFLCRLRVYGWFT